MWYYTNAGLDHALRNSNTTDDEAMVMLQQPNGSTSWIPAASAATASGIINNKDILWEDLCQAAPRMIVAMEEADWSQDRVTMLAKFWGNLQVHKLRSSRDPLDQKTLIVYLLWHSFYFYFYYLILSYGYEDLLILIISILSRRSYLGDLISWSMILSDLLILSSDDDSRLYQLYIITYCYDFDRFSLYRCDQIQSVSDNAQASVQGASWAHEYQLEDVQSSIHRFENG